MELERNHMARSCNYQRIMRFVQEENRPCDICGDVGYADLRVTCQTCKNSNEHIYCMRKHLCRVPDKWFCEACPQSERMDNARISDKKRTGSSQTILGSPSKRAAHSLSRSMKVVETGKVKFLPAEDVVMLSSGAKTKARFLCGRLGSQTGSSRTLHSPISKRTPVSVAEASKMFSQKVSTHGSSGPSKPSVLGSGRSSNSSLQPRVAKTSPKSHDEKSPLHSPSYRSSNCSGPTKLEAKEKPKESQLLRKADAGAHRSPLNCSGPMELEAKEKPREPQLRKADAEAFRSPSNCSGPMELEAKGKPKAPQLLRKADTEAYCSPSNYSGPMELEAKGKPKEPQLRKADAEAYRSPSNCFGHLKCEAKDKPKEPQFFRMDKPAEEVRTTPNKEHVCKEEPVHGSLPVKEDGSSRHASLPPGESKNFSGYEGLPDYLAINATWMGSFEILDTVPIGGLYEGLQAHPPGKIHSKAYGVSKQMPKMMQFKLHPRRDVWPDIFKIDCPTGDDIALYFLPADFERSKEKYSSLLNLIEMRDLAMQSCLNGVELLIFTSKQLPANSQRINMKFYLWGVFRSLKKQLCSSSKPLIIQHEDYFSLCDYGNIGDPLNVINGEDATGVDMEIDMVGGIDVGRIDQPIQKPNSEGKKVQFKLKTPQRVCINSNVLDLSIVKLERPTEPATPLGFSKLVTSDAGHKDLFGPPGFSKPFNPKEMGNSSEINHKKEKSVILDVNPLSSSTKHSSFSDTSKRDFKGSSLHPQKRTEVSKSPEFLWKYPQEAVNGPPMHSVTTDLKPLSEKRKNVFDAIQYDVKDGLLGSPPQNYQVWDDLKMKAKVREHENHGVTEHEKKEPSSKRRHITVGECLQLFPKVEKTEDQQLETGTKLKLDSSGKKLVEDKDSSMLSLPRPLYMKHGQR